MAQVREKFATQVNSEILAAVRTLAQSEGRQLQALVDEALSKSIRTPSHARTSWARISPVAKNMSRFTRSSLSDRLSLWPKC